MVVTLSRNIDSTLLTEIGKTRFHPVLLVYLDWPGAPVRAHSNVGTISFLSQSWTGVGAFGGIRLPEESSGLVAQTASVSLFGLGDALDAYLDDDIRGRTATIYFGCVTTRAGNTLVGTPLEIYNGYMDSMQDVTQRADGGLSRGVQIGLAQGPSQRQRGEFYHTYEDQIRAYPGDTAGRFAINAEAETAKLTWPA